MPMNINKPLVRAPHDEPAAHRAVGIGRVSEMTGLSVDTLRWYERQGLVPLVDRTSDGTRRYSSAAVRFLRLVQALRRTGMPVAKIREFVQMGVGTAWHERRLAILAEQRDAILRRRAELDDDLTVIDGKIAHYQDLTARGLDCEDEITAGVQR